MNVVESLAAARKYIGSGEDVEFLHEIREQFREHLSSGTHEEDIEALEVDVANASFYFLAGMFMASANEDGKTIQVPMSPEAVAAFIEFLTSGQ